MPTKKTSKIKLVSTNELPSKPASEFGPAGQALWDSIVNEYSIEDSGGIALLKQICHAQDRVEQLAAQIEIDGPVVMVRGTPKAHPALRDEISFRSFITRNIARLGLNFEPVKPSVGRPPGAY